jgi:AAA domain
MSAPRKSCLSGGSTGIVRNPERILVYGPEGIGKSTFAAKANACAFIPLESGDDEIDVTFRTDSPQTFDELLQQVSDFTIEDHSYETLALDGLGVCETLIWQAATKRMKVQSIEEPGWGKGYNEALIEWKQLLASLDRLRAKRNMRVILIGHSIIKTFKNPMGEDYDRYQISLNEKAGALLKSWATTVFFAHHEEFASAKQGKRAKGMFTGNRVLETERTAAWDAKNRHALPEQIALDWHEYASLVDDFYGITQTTATCDELKSDIADLIDQVNPDPKQLARITESVSKARDNSRTLKQIKSRLEEILKQKEPNHE